MYEKLLGLVLAKAKLLEWEVPAPATIVELEALVDRSKKELGIAPPEEYLQLLRTVNGLDWNGLVVYGTHRSTAHEVDTGIIESFVDGNLNYRDHDPMKNYVIFADDGTALYTLNLTSKRYDVILVVGMSQMESFDSFDALIHDALKAVWPYPIDNPPN